MKKADTPSTPTPARSSALSVTREPGGSVTLPDDEGVAEMYADLQTMTVKRGYEQYEISNWARAGRESRHNLTYWRDEPYLGLGSGAASSWQSFLSRLQFSALPRTLNRKRVVTSHPHTPRGWPAGDKTSRLHRR